MPAFSNYHPMANTATDREIVEGHMYYSDPKEDEAGKRTVDARAI